VFIVNTPHDARKKLKLEYDDVAQWNPRLIYGGSHRLRGERSGRRSSRFDLTAFWARSGLFIYDARCWRAADMARGR